MIATKLAQFIGMAGMVILGSAACASTGAKQSAWPDDDRKNKNAEKLDSVVPQGDVDDDVPQDLEPGKLREPKTVAVPIKGSDLVRGNSTVVVNAPIKLVRKTILDFGKYADFMPHYKAARLLRRHKDGTREVYMQWSALHGAIKMWARFEMSPVNGEDGERWDSKFLDGNVRDAQAVWRIKELPNDRTELSLQVFLYPKLPLPASLLNEENTSGAEKGVVAMRKHIEELAQKK
jgi:ribosome-associated toxin RatA of RatAB toxin-antitoxin module